MIKHMFAKYDGTCEFCKERFHQGEQFLYDPEQRKGFHLGCPCITTQLKRNNHIAATTTRENIADIHVKTRDVQSHVLPQLIELFDGKFSVPCEYDGIKEHVTVWLKTLGKHTHFPGSRSIRVHCGQHDKKEFVRYAYITVEGQFRQYKEWQTSEITGKRREAVIAAVDLVLHGTNNVQLGIEYAKISSKCWRCGKDLTDPNTIQNLEITHGLGPECVKIVGKDTRMTEMVEKSNQHTAAIVIRV